MSNNFMMNTDEVRSSGVEQQDISQGFNGAVQNIFSTIESICASEWKGFSAETYNNLTNSYREPMRLLGDLIDSHARKDIDAANRFEDTDSDLASMMNSNL